MCVCVCVSPTQTNPLNIYLFVVSRIYAQYIIYITFENLYCVLRKLQCVFSVQSKLIGLLFYMSAKLLYRQFFVLFSHIDLCMTKTWRDELLHS